MPITQTLIIALLIILITIPVCIAITFFSVTLYIRWKQRVPEKYHYADRGHDYTFTLDENELDAPPTKSIDGTSAMDGFQKK